MAADIAAAEAFRRGLGWHLLLQVISVVHFAVAPPRAHQNHETQV